MRTALSEVCANARYAESCLHHWRSQDLIERGIKAPTSAAVESAALAVANKRSAKLENEVKVLCKAATAVEEVVPPERRFELVAELTAEGSPGQAGVPGPGRFPLGILRGPLSAPSAPGD